VGIIDTLSAGFRLVFRKPWLALVPLTIDLAIWRGPKLSMSVIVERMVGSLNDVAASLSGSSGATTDAMAEMIRILRETLAQTNLFGLFAWDSLGVPSITASLPIQTGDRVFQLTQMWQLALVEIAILAVGLLFAAAYLILIAQSVHQEPLALGDYVRGTLVAWTRLAVIALLVSIGIGSALLVSAILGPLSIIVMIGLFWIVLYISFFPQAITLARLRPVPALLSSFSVVRTNLWPTLGLLVLVNLLDSGLSLVWQRVIGAAPAGTIVAIVLSALIGSGLTAALFFYYRDRMAALRSLVAAAREA
jgi:hypothetical protein